MKTMIMVFVAMVSVAAAAEACTYVAKEFGTINNDLSIKALRVVEREMQKRGYTRQYDTATADYTLKFQADWSEWDGVGLGCGTAAAGMRLIQNSDNATLAKARADGTNGYLCGLFRDAKAIHLLKRVMKTVPECGELQ